MLNGTSEKRWMSGKEKYKRSGIDVIYDGEDGLKARNKIGTRREGGGGGAEG